MNNINTNNKIKTMFLRLNNFQKALILSGTIILAYCSYLLLFLIAAAMLPTIVAYFVDKKNVEKYFIVGFFNFAGASFFVVELFMEYSSDDLLAIFKSVFFWIASYGFAGIGLFFYCKVPQALLFFLKKYKKSRINKIDKKLKEIQNEWSEI